jgi:hypothetical protein
VEPVIDAYDMKRAEMKMGSDPIYEVRSLRETRE